MIIYRVLFSAEYVAFGIVPENMRRSNHWGKEEVVLLEVFLSHVGVEAMLEKPEIEDDIIESLQQTGREELLAQHCRFL